MASAQQGTRTRWSIPIAIVIAGALVASALYASSSNAPTLGAGAAYKVGNDFRMPSDNDHVRGNPEAKVALIEYSDFECPFCARLHPTLERIVSEREDVQWIYRHFPLSSIHSRALGAAHASECMAKLGGNDAFWAFADRVFADQSQLHDSLYERIASEADINPTELRSCMSDSAIASEVEKDRDEALGAGGRGTPFTIIVVAGGDPIPFSGALSYEDVRTLVDRALAN